MISCIYYLCRGSNNPIFGLGEPLQWAPGPFDTTLTRGRASLLALASCSPHIFHPRPGTSRFSKQLDSFQKEVVLETIVRRVIAFCVKGRQVNDATIKYLWTETEETRLGALKVSQMRHSRVAGGKDCALQCRVCGLDPWPENMFWGQKPKRKTEAIL